MSQLFFPEIIYEAVRVQLPKNHITVGALFKFCVMRSQRLLHFRTHFATKIATRVELRNEHKQQIGNTLNARMKGNFSEVSQLPD